MSNDLNNLLTPDEVASILGMSAGTLTVWRSTGRVNLPYVKIGKKVMYNPQDIQNFIENRTCSVTTESKKFYDFNDEHDQE